jgi:hypothetical protein
VHEDDLVTRRPRLRGGALRRRPRLAAGIGVWLTAAVVLGEVFDPPFDPVRLVVKLVLAGLMTWFLVSFSSSLSGSED